MKEHRLQTILRECPGLWFYSTTPGEQSVTVDPQYIVSALAHLRRHRVTVTRTYLPSGCPDGLKLNLL